MFRELENRRPAQCLSDLSLDSFLSGEQSATAAATIRAHLDSCAQCSQRKREFLAEREQFLASAPARASGFLAPRRSRVVYSAWAMGALAAASFLFMLSAPPSEQSIREKGSAELGFYLKRGEQVQRGRSAQPVQPGDLVRFVYSSSRTRYLAVLSLDAAQHASVYFPEAPLASRVTAGTDVALPSSVLLDQTLGREQVVALFCDAPVPLAPLRTLFEQSGSLSSLPAGCETHTLVLHKQALAP
jgi:anti-sigma factor RsiW